jgi:hypothetical protein
MRRTLKEPLNWVQQAIAKARREGLAGFASAQTVILSISKRALNALLWKFRGIMDRGNRLSVHARLVLLDELLRRGRSWPSFLPEFCALDVYDFAEARYMPGSLSISNIVLVRARKGEGSDRAFRDIYADEAFGWNAIVGNLTIIDVEGGHSTMFREPFVGVLAQALIPFLQRDRLRPHLVCEGKGLLAWPSDCDLRQP